MEFRILGPVEVLRDDVVVPLGGRRERAVLALLLLSPNEVVSVDRLTDALWADGPPGTAVHTLRVYVSRLRRALAAVGASEALLTRSPGYLIRVEPDALDASRFDGLVARARDQARRAHHGQAAATFTEALRLWRGPALADVAEDFAFAGFDALRLEEGRLAATEGRIEADLACGREREVIVELEALTRQFPLRERLWAQRMLALQRLGRPAEALAIYQKVDALLRDEHGIAPNAELRALHLAILRDEAAEPAAVRSGSELPLPALLTDLGGVFVGRTTELDRLGRHWGAGDVPLVLVSGEPGVGKTRLAAEFARRVHDNGAPVLTGRCDEHLGVPYQPFVEALRQVVGQLSARELAPRLGRHGGELSRLVPDLAALVPDLPAPLRSDPETERYRLFDAVCSWLVAMAADRGLLLVLDDLQWASRPTLLLLRHISRNTAGSRLLILGAYRDAGLGREHPLVETLADLRRHASVERLPLPGLGQADIAAVLQYAENSDRVRADDPFVRPILRDDGGQSVLRPRGGSGSRRRIGPQNGPGRSESRAVSRTLSWSSSFSARSYDSIRGGWLSEPPRFEACGRGCRRFRASKCCSPRSTVNQADWPPPDAAWVRSAPVSSSYPWTPCGSASWRWPLRSPPR